MKNINGFTLIELLVVVLIIGVLAAIALPQYQLAVGKSKFAAVKSIAKAIANAEEHYYDNKGKYTTDFNALDITKPSNVNCYVWADITSQKAVACYTYVNNTTMAYYQFFNNDNPHNNNGKRACFIFSTDRNDIPNRICQNDTGIKTGSDDGGYIRYYYK